MAFAKERQAFGASLGRLQLIHEIIATISVKVDAARLLVYKAAWSFGADGEPDLKDLSTAKIFRDRDRLGMRQPHHPGAWRLGLYDDCAPSRYLRDNRVRTIGDGSSQIQLLLIARANGLDVSFRREPILAAFEVSSVPLSLTIIFGLPSSAIGGQLTPGPPARDRRVDHRPDAFLRLTSSTMLSTRKTAAD